MKAILAILFSLVCIGTASAQPQWGGANSNTPPFNYMLDTSNAYQINSLNSLHTVVEVKTGTSANKTIALKGCTAADKGKTITFKDGDNNAGTYTITITPNSGTIDNAANYVLTGNSSSINLVCNGSSDWISKDISGMATDARNASIPSAINNLTANITAHTYYARAYGACTWDSTSTSDVGPCINSAITAALANRTSDASYTYSGGVVELPEGIFSLKTTVLQEVKTGVTIRGAGGAGAGICRTALVWNGAAAGVMAQMGKDTLNQIIGGGWEGVCLLGNDLAGTGLMMRSAVGGLYRDMFIENTTSRAVDMNPSTNDTNGVADNVFYKFKIALTSATAINSHGWYIGAGTTNNNTFGNTWLETHVKYQNGNAVYCQNADSNIMLGLTAQPVSGGTGRSIRMFGSPTNSLLTCRHNRFIARNDLGSNNAATAPVAETDTFPSLANYVWQNVGSGGQLPVVNGSATLTYDTSIGNHYSNSATQFIHGGFSFKPGGSNNAVLDHDEANTNNAATAAKFGPTLPVYLMYNSPCVGLNMVWDGVNWVFGKGSSSNFAARICENKTTGAFNIVSSTAGGNAAGTVTDRTLLELSSDGVMGDTAFGNHKVATGALTSTDATLATVTGLTQTLLAGKTYACTGHLTVSAADAAGGIKVRINTSDTLTATSSSFTAANFNGATTNARTTAAFASDIGAATAVVTNVEISGTIVVNAAGTIRVQAAKNVAAGTDTVVAQNGSWFSCVRVN